MNFSSPSIEEYFANVPDTDPVAARLFQVFQDVDEESMFSAALIRTERFDAIETGLPRTVVDDDWPAILTPARIRVCWYLDTPRTAAKIAERLDIPKDTLQTTAADYGLTNHIDSIYTALTERYPDSPDTLPSESEYSQLKAQYEVA